MSESHLEPFAPDCDLVSAVHPAANFNDRVDGGPIDVLLLHYTGMEDEDAAIKRLTIAESSVSCHYFVKLDGTLLQFVPEDKRAWHAGISAWHGVPDINSRSIGVEIANSGHDFGYPEFAAPQIETIKALAIDCGRRRHIPAERILAHSDVAPSRKQDPGEKFPWAELFRAGIGHYVEPAPITGGRFFQRGDAGAPIEAYQSMLALYGYSIEIDGVFGIATEQVTKAFQRHFRPALVDGIADSSTIDTLHRLLQALPKYR